MKAQSIGKRISLKKGSMTLEILIAFAVLIFCISAVISLSFGNQSVSIDSETNNEAIGIAKKIIEDARKNSRQDYASVKTTLSNITSGGLTYNKTLSVDDLTECLKIATSTVSWTSSPTRTQKIEFSTYLSDITGATSLGGDCILNTPTSNWDNPQRFASDTFSPGKPTAIDVLNKVAYIGQDKTPYLAIADTNVATQGQNSGIFVTITNGFIANGVINDIDVINKIDASGNVKKYAFAAMNTTTKQLQVIDVTDIHKPISKALISLSSCVAGSTPQGWVVYYYGDRLYLTTRYTAGPEFHIFNVSDPTSPTEIGSGSCKGTYLDDTVEDMVVKDQIIAGVKRRFVYMATDEDDKELRVLEVTGDVVTEMTIANKDLLGIQDGASVFSVGNKLYFGRQSTSGSDFYVFDITNPLAVLPTLGQVDIGTGVTGIRISGKYAFISTPKVNKEFQVWNISNLSSITNIATYNFGNIVSQGLDYEPDFIYATGQSTPNFQILYSP